MMVITACCSKLLLLFAKQINKKASVWKKAFMRKPWFQIWPDLGSARGKGRVKRKSLVVGIYDDSKEAKCVHSCQAGRGLVRFCAIRELSGEKT